MHKTKQKPEIDPTKSSQKPTTKIMFKSPAPASSMAEKRNQRKLQQQRDLVVQTEAAKISGHSSTLPPEIIQEEEDEEEDEFRAQLELMEEEEAAAVPIMTWKLETVTGLPMDPDVRLIDL